MEEYQINSAAESQNVWPVRPKLKSSKTVQFDEKQLKEQPTVFRPILELSFYRFYFIVCTLTYNNALNLLMKKLTFRFILHRLVRQLCLLHTRALSWPFS